MTSLVWFRNDLRVADNPALTAACHDGGPVRACFFITPDQWQAHDWSPARVQLIHRHLATLTSALAERGIPMDIRTVHTFSNSVEALGELCRQHGVSRVHFNEEYAVNERRRDRATRDQLAEHGVTVLKYRDQTVAPVGSVKTQQGDPYTVFTPFSKRWRAWTEQNDCQPLPAPGPVGEPVSPAAIPAVPEDFARDVPPLVDTGEEAAHRALTGFLKDGGDRYKEERDFPAKPATSLLSPYLASGILSGRQCLQAARTAMMDRPGSEGIQTWINEIAWRDFYIHILYHFPRVSRHQAFKPDTEALSWHPAGPLFEAWKAGKTGIPIVDAAMRQLRETGWMHNRLRMVTAMFLTKNLFIDWREGEAWFMQNLADGYLPSNNGGWQWSASTGTDAAPYFRVFNPVTQSQRFDPDGTFIRYWVPELRDMDSKRIHQPGDGRPVRYPAPVVDLKTSRKAAIEAFQALKKD
ncbi:deoxyribodipyrimidine photo-lyase [Tamilnaduibacter salinus]|uniref:Deoxyribodipyrimidine photo-lyase n=1 Tax=Tamilnaduibacter salinus TaxID=1484056 RepID=A0A2U1D0U7_9GAMM|nr:deoxyribodipyrimidine photo-lyase [Tamilnaduibacter salinus]PVY78928.1 deoxyribodipyrimidine photo-lyase [Tamilnaduibacter salinus]